jgi:hypothetical protein
MTKEEYFIYDNREAFIKATKVIKTVDLPLKLAKNDISADLIGAIMLDELQRRDWLDNIQDIESRFLNSAYTKPLKNLGRWLLSKTFKPIDDISLGPAQMKPTVVEDLIQEQLIVKPDHWEQQKVDIITKWLLDPQKAAELIGARLEQIVRHWAKGGVDISNKPEILGTLYSIGLVGQAGVNDHPRANERGEKIANELRLRVRQILAVDRLMV